MNFMPSQTIFAPATESYDANPGGPIDRTGEDWTEEQILLLASLVRGEGLSNAAAAARMGRTEPPIATAVSRTAPAIPGRSSVSASRAARSSSRCTSATASA